MLDWGTADTARFCRATLSTRFSVMSRTYCVHGYGVSCRHKSCDDHVWVSGRRSMVTRRAITSRAMITWLSRFLAQAVSVH